MAPWRKIKRFLLIIFLVTLGVKIRSEYLVLSSIDELDVPKQFFTNASTQTDNTTVIHSKMSPESISQRKLASNSSLKDKESLNTSKLSQLETTAGNFSTIQNQYFSSDTLTSNETRSKDSSPPLSQNDNPLFKKMMERAEKQRAKDADLRRQMIEMIKNKGFPPNSGEKKKTVLDKVKEKIQKNQNGMNKRSVIAVSHTVDAAESSLNATEKQRVSEEVDRINREQLIHNQDTYGPLQSTDVVILIQVHSRLNNLRFLVSSLAQARNITSSLVIFSHDFYDEEMNKFIRTITDFRVMQMFLPHSIQLSPDKFPGRDRRDCKWDHDASKVKTHCLNEKWPDSFGHYREATFTQIKHHWWWKFVRVFKELQVTKNFSGPVLFLEEDHYVAPDIIHVLKLFVETGSRKEYQNFLVYALGNYQRVVGNSLANVDKGEWTVNRYNMGFVLDRRTFNIIYGCSSSFCLCDDYNWDWSLAYVSKNCAQNQLNMLALKMTRVFHIGNCGTHYRQANCNLELEVENVKKRLNAVQKYLFPSTLNILSQLKITKKQLKLNGGWGDYRDRTLCLAVANATVAETLSELRSS